MLQKTTLILLLIATLSSCKKSDTDQAADNEKGQIKMARWFLGEWENKSAEGTLVENWKKANDSTYYGQSYFIKNKDTLHFETITLQQNGEELFYNAKVIGQNEDKSVRFKMTNSSENQLVFENPNHDYPQKISYTKKSNDSLVAEISGVQLGKPSSEKFLMKKIRK